jgi:hypothetical protein
MALSLTARIPAPSSSSTASSSTPLPVQVQALQERPPGRIDVRGGHHSGVEPGLERLRLEERGLDGVKVGLLNEAGLERGLGRHQGLEGGHGGMCVRGRYALLCLSLSLSLSLSLAPLPEEKKRKECKEEEWKE